MTPTQAQTRSLPYGRHAVDEDDIAAVVETLRSDWLTTGPQVEKFEEALCAATGAAHAVAVSSGTAALHAAMHALGIGPGDEVVVPALTFAATANAVVFEGGTPVFADVGRHTLLVDPADVARKLTSRTRAVVAVDYAGQPCDYEALQALCDERGIALVADACHSLGATYRGRPVGSLARLSAFSFHPVKHVTTGEGGAVTTDDHELARRLRLFRNHGISTDHRERAATGAHFYEMVDLGCNYRLSDIACALGASQLRKLAGWVQRRQELAQRYDEAIARIAGIEPVATVPDVTHARHLYVVRAERRDEVFAALRAHGIGANVHYVPVHLHPYYRRRLGTGLGLCPVAEDAYPQILSLPLFPAMDNADVDGIVAAVRAALGEVC